MEKMRVILDTDIGTDVDDCLALAVLLASPELELVGVTTVYGDVLLRARMVMKLLRLRGREDVPVAMGERQPLLGKRAVYWEGHEGKGVLVPEDERLMPVDEHAVDFIVRTVMAQPGAGAPPCRGADDERRTGLPARAAPGGKPGQSDTDGRRRGRRGRPTPAVDGTQLQVRPGSVPRRAGGRARPVVVPLDVTTRVCIRPEGVARIRAAGDPFHRAVADQVDLIRVRAARLDAPA